VLQRILLLSLEAIGGSSGSIIVLDEEGHPVDAALVFGDQVYERTLDQLRATLENGLAGWVVRHKQAALVPDTSQDERWLRREDDAEDRRGAKSAVSAPLILQDRLVGVMTLVHSTPGTFTQEHLDLVVSIADLASVAVLNARLLEDIQRKARIMTALAESALAINVSLRLEDVFKHVLEQTQQTLSVEAASLATVNHQTNMLEFRAAIGEGAQQVLNLQLPLGQGIAGWVAKEGRPLVVPNVQDDPRFFPEFDRQTGFTTRAVACVPIVREGEVLGVLQAINPTSGAFDPHAILLLSGIGSMAGFAIRHAQLFELVQSAQKRFRDLFEDSVDPILVTDWEGNIVEANRRMVEITGLPLERLRTMRVDETHQIDRGHADLFFEKLQSGQTVSYESELKTQQMGTIPIEVHVRLVQIEGVDHLQWILRDISERKELDTLREDLIAMIYHDLRSPLANVISSLDVLGSLLNLEDEPSLASVLQIAIRSTERIQRLTDSLLDMSKLEAKQPVRNQRPVAPLDLVNEAVEAVLPIANNKNQKIRVTVSPDLPLIYVDQDMMRRVVINLLENAVKFTPEGGRIFVGAESENGQLTLWVQDTGPGIPPEDRERIFEKFIRSKDAEDRQVKGLGLGLAFCRLAVEGHGGRIWVVSKPGAGSRFLFSLPVATEEQIQAHRQAEESAETVPALEGEPLGQGASGGSALEKGSPESIHEPSLEQSPEEAGETSPTPPVVKPFILSDDEEFPLET
jgi:PAS domain S-box-containing protein